MPGKNEAQDSSDEDLDPKVKKIVESKIKVEMEESQASSWLPHFFPPDLLFFNKIYFKFSFYVYSDLIEFAF